MKKERKGEQKYEVTDEERHIREEREVKNKHHFLAGSDIKLETTKIEVKRERKIV